MLFLQSNQKWNISVYEDPSEVPSQQVKPLLSFSPILPGVTDTESHCKQPSSFETAT